MLNSYVISYCTSAFAQKLSILILTHTHTSWRRIRFWCYLSVFSTEVKHFFSPLLLADRGLSVCKLCNFVGSRDWFDCSPTGIDFSCGRGQGLSGLSSLPSVEIYSLCQWISMWMHKHTITYIHLQPYIRTYAQTWRTKNSLVLIIALVLCTLTVGVGGG